MSFAAAAAASPGYLPAQIGLVRLVAVGGRLNDAMRNAERLAMDHPKSAEVHMLLSDLRTLSGDHAGSIAALEEAVRVDRVYTPARYALMAALIEQQQFDAAAAHLEQVRLLNKRDLRIQYFDAVIALSKNDLVKARELSQRILKHSPEHVPSLGRQRKLNFRRASCHWRRTCCKERSRGRRSTLVRAGCWCEPTSSPTSRHDRWKLCNRF